MADVASPPRFPRVTEICAFLDQRGFNQYTTFVHDVCGLKPRGVQTAIRLVIPPSPQAGPSGSEKLVFIHTHPAIVSDDEYAETTLSSPTLEEDAVLIHRKSEDLFSYILWQSGHL
jgi:hypothetical protein